MSDQPRSDELGSDQPGRGADARHGRDDDAPPAWLSDLPSTDERPRHSADPAETTQLPRYPSEAFRDEQRFSEGPPPAQWTDPTPPTGFPAVGQYSTPPGQQAGHQQGPPPGQPWPPAPSGAYPPGAVLPPPYRPDVPQTPYPDLATHALLKPVKPAPTSGWRRWLYVLSGKTINVGESPKDAHRRNLVAHVNHPLQGCYKIAVLSLKGGVGKTTITATLGATLASIRGDRVVAVDANPDRGTLSQKVALETPATVRDLLHDADNIERYSDVRRYTSQGPSRLEVLASESDPAVSEAFSSQDYARTLEVLERFYSLVLTDCGTGLMHSAMSAVLSSADTLIVVSSGSVDGARSASATLDWLDAHGHEDLVRNSVCVVNAVRPRSGKVDMQKVVDHFSRRCRAVRLVPFDPHLEEGAEISLDRLQPSTRDALIELAAVVADGFPSEFRPR
ncbi:ATPase [Mycolicibacterium chitae]|uniref:ATPase n=1 Tax=Mycolicibacterium chitae TaxID=1792 RepID=A0A448IBJ5_MYCCI|nr:ATPase [Mycolicibacterium chitae]VEG49717.1 ATPase [Mycolicibacterium chitae]